MYNFKIYPKQSIYFGYHSIKQCFWIQIFQKSKSGSKDFKNHDPDPGPKKVQNITINSPKSTIRIHNTAINRIITSQ